MNTALRLFLGLPVPRGEFEGTAAEKRIYEYAVRQWRAAGYALRSQPLVSPTFGATVTRLRGTTRRAA